MIDTTANAAQTLVNERFRLFTAHPNQLDGQFLWLIPGTVCQDDAQPKRGIGGSSVGDAQRQLARLLSAGERKR